MKEKIYVFGHQKPDTDSVTSAISVAYLKQQLGFNAEARILGEPNKETKFVLDYFKVKTPAYLDSVRLQIKDVDYYKNYQKLLKEGGINLLLPEKNKRNEVILQPQKYLGTDIYRASREIKKMQKLTTSNILTVWYEKLNGGKLLPGE